MASADEKQAKQDARDYAASAAQQGKERLHTEVGKAAKAFSGRPLRSAGDLSRYMIGGFTGDPVAKAGKPKTAPKKVVARTRTIARRAPVVTKRYVQPVRTQTQTSTQDQRESNAIAAKVRTSTAAAAAAAAAAARVRASQNQRER